MRVLMVKKGKVSFKEVENELKPLQELVGGYLETLTLNNDFVVVMDEEGRLKGKTCFAEVKGVPIVGDFFICASTGEDFTDINDNTLALAKKYLTIKEK